MHIKDGFILREICGVHVLSAEGDKMMDFTKLISLNDTSVYLYEQVKGEDFTPETLADLLCDKYEVSREVALADCKALCTKMAEAGILE